jgi:septum site-determining protein MinC
MAFAFSPQPPIADWLAALDAMLKRSKGFFAGHPVALDLSAAQLDAAEIAQLVAALEARHIRVLGIEGVEPSSDLQLPPVLRAARASQDIELPEPAVSGANAEPAGGSAHAEPAVSSANAVAKKEQPTSLMIESPVRSGQSVVFIEGDVTVLGSVGSGAEIIAGGSIHIYGTLRGLAMAGAAGDARARIFCHRFEGELLAIGPHYRTAEEIDDSLRRGPTQAWLDGNTLRISAMN